MHAGCAALTSTFFAFQSNAGLQVVHLHLQALEGEIVFPRLPLVGDEYEDDNDEEETATCCDANDGGEGQEAVRHDVHRSWRHVEASNLNL